MTAVGFWLLGFGMGASCAVLAGWAVSMCWLPRQRDRSEPTAIGAAMTSDTLRDLRAGRETRR